MTMDWAGTLDDGLWTMDSGPWTLAPGLAVLVYHHYLDGAGLDWL